MSSNLICLSLSKAEFIIIGLPAQIKKIPDPSIHLATNSASLALTLDAIIRNFGVTFHHHLSFSNHICNVSRSSLIQIQDLRCMLEFKTASTTATSVVQSQLATASSLTSNLSKHTCTGCYSKASSVHHSYPQITPLSKNTNAHPLQSAVT